jgi:energy-coupling factor transport system permease protein
MSFNNIPIGNYIYGTSVIHRLDPRIKLITLTVFVMSIFISNGLIPLAIGGWYIFTAIFLSGIDGRLLLRSLKPFIWLILITFILNAIFVQGHIIIRAPLPSGGITAEGIETGLLYSVRIGLFIAASSLVTYTTEPIMLVDSIEYLMRPLEKVKINPHDIALAMVITLRFIPILLEEATKIVKSHRARGFRPSKKMIKNVKYFPIFFLPLFVSAVDRAQKLAIAMDSRLFQSGKPRTKYITLMMTSHDWLAFAMSVVITLCMVMV